MTVNEIPKNGAAVTLTGDEIKLIRKVLGEKQSLFARRFAVTQPVICRMEAKADEPQSGPIVLLIWMLAREYRINLKRPAEEQRVEMANAGAI